MNSLEHALAYARLGWRVVPIPPGFKYPQGIDNWQDKATTDERKIVKHWMRNSTHGVGIATGPGSGIVAIDIDSYAGGDEGLAELEKLHGPLPDTVEAITGRNGRHLLFMHPDDGGPVITNADHALPPGIDVRGDGGQIVVAPTIHPETGQAYAWDLEHDPLDGYPVAVMPAWLAELLRTPAPEQAARADRIPYSGTDSIVDLFASQHAWPELLGADGWTFHSKRVEYGTGELYELWTRPGKQTTAGASASLYYRGSDVLKVFTSAAAPLVGGETYTRFGYWAAMNHLADHRAAAGAYRRQINGTTRTTTMTATEIDDDAEAEATVGAQPYTDLGNARQLVESHGADLRYAPQLGTWLRWDGHRWAEDVTGEATRRAKAVVDAMLTQLATMVGGDARKKLFSHWTRSQSAGRLEAMVSLARTEPGIPVTVAELDADPWILNTLGGAVELTSGDLGGHDRRHLVTKLAPVRYDPQATCPTWLWFLDWAMRGDAELVGFLQRCVGYSLTGTVGEQCLFFLHGAGANGKSTFLNVLGRLMGDYAISAEADLLLATTQERHSTGIADLVGRRLVVVQETDEGRRLAEATVKKLTGGDTIRARRMRQDNFEFEPTHKLWMAANHRPVIRGTDHAIWRRIRLIPFEAQVDPAEQDDRLLEKLLAELPGILNWALDGCRVWRSSGLQPPDAVVAATRSYRSEQDHIGRFLDDCCTLADGLAVTATDLRAAYEAWCKENGENPWSAKAMAPHLVERGCAIERTNSARMWRHIALAGAAADELSRRLDRGDWAKRASGERENYASQASSTRVVDHTEREKAPVTLSDAYSCSPLARAPTEGDTEKASHASPSVTGLVDWDDEPF